jgi:hypothetical protein
MIESKINSGRGPAKRAVARGPATGRVIARTRDTGPRARKTARLVTTKQR